MVNNGVKFNHWFKGNCIPTSALSPFSLPCLPKKEMSTSILSTSQDPAVKTFIAGKSDTTLALLHHFLQQYEHLDQQIYLYPTKSMLGIGINDQRIAWVTQLGKNFVHIVFPFKKAYPDNLCFQKIAQVPGDAHQFNHHFRMYLLEDVNEEVLQFMRIALTSTI